MHTITLYYITLHYIHDIQTDIQTDVETRKLISEQLWVRSPASFYSAHPFANGRSQSAQCCQGTTSLCDLCEERTGVILLECFSQKMVILAFTLTPATRESSKNELFCPPRQVGCIKPNSMKGRCNDGVHALHLVHNVFDIVKGLPQQLNLS